MARDIGTSGLRSGMTELWTITPLLSSMMTLDAVGMTSLVNMKVVLTPICHCHLGPISSRTIDHLRNLLRLLHYISKFAAFAMMPPLPKFARVCLEETYDQKQAMLAEAATSAMNLT